MAHSLPQTIKISSSMNIVIIVESLCLPSCVSDKHVHFIYSPDVAPQVKLYMLQRDPEEKG